MYDSVYLAVPGRTCLSATMEEIASGMLELNSLLPNQSMSNVVNDDLSKVRLSSAFVATMHFSPCMGECQAIFRGFASRIAIFKVEKGHFAA